MFDKELEEFIQNNWTDEEKYFIKRLTENLVFYKKLIPKNLKQDILNALQLCNKLKLELDTYRTKCECLLRLVDGETQELKLEEIKKNDEQ
jgi:hypothetical protein